MMRYRVTLDFVHVGERATLAAATDCLAWSGDDLAEARAVMTRLLGLGCQIVDSVSIDEWKGDTWHGVETIATDPDSEAAEELPADPEVVS